jgi:hypothetical protein
LADAFSCKWCGCGIWHQHQGTPEINALLNARAAAAARFAEALEVVPRTIAENSGLQATEVLARLYAAHAQGQVRMFRGKDLDQKAEPQLYAAHAQGQGHMVFSTRTGAGAHGVQHTHRGRCGCFDCSGVCMILRCYAWLRYSVNLSYGDLGML